MTAIVPALIVPDTIKTENEIVFSVNGIPVESAEFRTWMVRKNKAIVFGYFRQVYEARYSSNFWTDSFGGEVPIEKARKRTLHDLTFVKVQQKLMLQHGIAADLSYAKFKRRFERDNSLRKEAFTDRKIIYGPVQYEEGPYFDYLFTNAVIRLKRVLGLKLLRGNNDSLEEHISPVAGGGADSCGEDAGCLPPGLTSEKSSRELIDREYDKYIRHLVGKADIRINGNVYERIMMD